MKTIYLSGPISGIPIEVAKDRFAKAEKWLADQGYNIINPMTKVPEDMGLIKTFSEANVPTLYYKGTDISNWGDCMRIALAYVLLCHEVHMLPNWQNSAGAQLEREVALRLGIPFKYIDVL